MYYWVKTECIKWYFEAIEWTFGIPNDQLGFGRDARACYVPLAGSICFEDGDKLVYVDDSLYELQPLLYPTDECLPVLKEDKHYDTLMNGFGI